MTLLRHELFELLRGYLALTPTKFLTFPSHLPPTEIHDFFLESLLNGPLFQLYPPAKQYQATFWRWAIGQLENTVINEDVEIDERIYEYYMSILPPSAPTLGPMTADMKGQFCPRGAPLRAPPSQSYVTYFWRPVATSGNDSLQVIDTEKYQTTTLLESRATIENGTTGLRTWLASFALSQYLITHADMVTDKRILELGSGTGFLGSVVASLQKLFGSRTAESELISNNVIWMTDVNDVVLSRCRTNIQLSNNLSSKHSNVNYRVLDWSDALDQMASVPVKSLTLEIDADLLLGADIIFDPTLIPGLIAMLSLSLKPSPRTSHKVALLALTIRNEDTLTVFLHAAQQYLVVEDLHARLDTDMFFKMTKDSSDANAGIKIFRISTKERL